MHSDRSAAALETLWVETEKEQKTAPWHVRVGRVAFGETLGRLIAPIEHALDRALPSDGSRVVTVDALSEGVLRELFVDHTACAVRVPRFCSPELARALGEWIVSTSGVNELPVDSLSGIKKSDMFYGIGTPFIVATQSREDFYRYFLESIPAARRAREAAGGASPIDRLRLELDERWPAGASLATYKGRKMNPAIARVMTPGGMLDDAVAKVEGMCHCDASPILPKQGGFFSANVYLDVPPDGGELCVWNVRARLGDLVANRTLLRHLFEFDTKGQAHIRARLPPPLTIKPEPGDLVLINSGRPHAVRGFAEGRRITMQTFIKASGLGEVLTISV
jgi:hypothetical protein